MTTGRVYQAVIQKERNLEYKGKCVEVVPHIPMEIRDRIYRATEKTKADIMIIEIGGTVGEYQNMLFLEAARMMKLYNPKNVQFVMVSYLPIPNKIGEMKTKPTQYAIRTLNSAGIQPDFVIARSELPVDEPRRKKIAVWLRRVLNKQSKDYGWSETGGGGSNIVDLSLPGQGSFPMPITVDKDITKKKKRRRKWRSSKDQQ